MNYSKPDVSTIWVGMAASMAAVLLAAGAPGKRFSLPHSKIMIHQPSGGAQGQQTEIEIAAREIRETRNTLNQILADCTGKPFEQVERDTERDNYLRAEQALEYGLIDRSGGAQGQQTEIEIAAREIRETRNTLNQILADCTGKPFEQVERDTERDNYLRAEQALEYGLIDRIVTSRNDSGSER